MPEYWDEYSIFEVDPANVPKGPERVIVTDDSHDFFTELDKKSAAGIIDRANSLTKAYRDYLSSLKSLPAPAPTPKPPPVPSTTAISPAPTQSPPLSSDSPQQQGASDVEATLIVEARPSDKQVSRNRASDRFWEAEGQSPPRSAEEVVSIVTPPALNPADFDDLVRRTLQNAPSPGEPHPSHAEPATRTPAAAGDPVDLFLGAFTIGAVDLVVPTADIPIAMSRSYRSGRPYFGPLGFGWDHTYNVYLRQLNDGGVAFWTGRLRELTFRRDGSGWEPEPGAGARLERVPGPTDVYALHFSGGMVWIFEQPAGWGRVERIPLSQIRDRHGNRVNITYDSLDRVASVFDEARRGLLFHYGSCDLLERVSDHTGTRAVRYVHATDIEHLVRVVLPPTGRYPEGISTTYVYDTFPSHPAMQHNILRIHDAEDRLMVENEFADPGSVGEFNRIVRQRIDGFEFQFEYEQIQYVWPDPIYTDVLATRTLVRPPDGSLHTYTFNYRGDLLDHRFRLIRDGSFRVVASRWRHDTEGNVTEQVGPDGLRSVFTYDSTNTDPCARRNLIRVEIAAPLSGIFTSRVVFKAQYEPRYQLATRTEDENGAEVRLFYDFDANPVGATGRLTRIEQPAVQRDDGTVEQSILTFEHEAHGRLSAAVTPEGGRIELSYVEGGDHDGFVAAITRDPVTARLVLTCEYDTAGFPSVFRAQDGRTAGVTHNALGQIEERRAPEVGGLTATMRRWFDDSGAVVRIERPAGSYAAALLPDVSIVDEYERDVGGNVRRVTLAANTDVPRTWLQRVDHEGRPVSIWDPAGTRIERCFGEDGALLSETFAHGDSEAQTTDYSYDRAGRVTRIVGPWGDETTFDYDVWGRPKQITLPNGAVRTIVSGATDLILEERLEGAIPSGQVSRPLLWRQTFEYDERSRLVATTVSSFRDDPAVAVPLRTRYVYDRDDNVREVLLPRGARYEYVFDPIGRLTEVTDLHGTKSHLSYGASGDLSEVTKVEVGVARSSSRRFFYDARGRLTRSELLGSFAEFQYDDRDFPVEQRAPTGVTNRVQFDPHGLVIESLIDPGGTALRSRFAYDVNGRLNRYIDPTGQATTWERDALGRPASVKPPDGTNWHYRTNTKARTIEQRMPSGNRVVLEYAPNESRPVGMQCVAAPGQEAIAPHAFAYDGLGRLVSSSVGADSILRRYDSLGRLVEETARGRSVRTEYDDTAGAAVLEFPDGRREQTEYNNTGQATRIVLIAPGDLGGTPGDVLLEIVYSTAGRPVQLIYGNGVEGQIAYDDYGRVIRIEYQRGGVLLDSCRLRYDDEGHRAVVQYLGVPRRNLVHRFDGNDRLVEVRSGFPLAALQDITDPAAQVVDVTAALVAATLAPGVAYSLDDADVRTATTGLNGGAVGETYLSAKDHRVIAVGASALSYNPDGHRTVDKRYAYELDALNRVRRVRDRVTNAIAAELQYDALSRVAAGATDGHGFERWFAGSTRVHEMTGPDPGSARQHSSHPLWQSPFHVLDAAGPAYIHQDEGLSTMCVTDATGAVVERHRHGFFGGTESFAADGTTTLSSHRTEPRWRGMPTLGTTSLSYSRHRLYDPEIGVFTSRDAMLYADSPSPYAYAAHNPVDFADPTGLAKSALADKGHSIAPPPPVSGTNYRAHMPHGFLWQQYEGALRDAWNPDNPGWARGVLGILAILAAPVAGAEEYGGRALLNVPFMIDNLGTGAGEHIGRAYLWTQQGESAEAAADLLGAIANFALGFLNLGMLAQGVKGSQAGGRPPMPARPAKPGTPPALKRIDNTPGLTKDQIVEQDLDAWARSEGGVRQPSHYGNNQGIDRVYTFPRGRPVIVGEAKFKSGYELGQLEQALGLLKPGLKFGRQGSFEYSFWQGIRMTTSKAPTITPAVRQTGSLILKNLPDHRRVLAVGNEFGELDVWDLDFWEMYEW